LKGQRELKSFFLFQMMIFQNSKLNLLKCFFFNRETSNEEQTLTASEKSKLRYSLSNFDSKFIEAFLIFYKLIVL
jgi:hypothetical protein